jgi:Spy/CpxP family protein refolding chaperone
MPRLSLRTLLIGAILLPVSVAIAGGDRMREMASTIGLSADQTVQVEDIMEEYRLNQVDNKAAVVKARMELHNLMDASTVDERAVRKAFDALMAAEREQAERRLEMGLSLRRVMTYEQWQAAQELRKDHRDERREGRPGRGEGPREENHREYEEGDLQ